MRRLSVVYALRCKWENGTATCGSALSDVCLVVRRFLLLGIVSQRAAVSGSLENLSNSGGTTARTRLRSSLGGKLECFLRVVCLTP